MVIWAGLLLQVALAADAIPPEEKFSTDCALATAAAIRQVEKEGNTEQAGGVSLRSKFKITRCNRSGKFANIEFLLSDDPNMMDGEMYFRVNIDDGTIVERGGAR